MRESTPKPLFFRGVFVKRRENKRTPKKMKTMKRIVGGHIKSAMERHTREQKVRIGFFAMGVLMIAIGLFMPSPNWQLALGGLMFAGLACIVDTTTTNSKISSACAGALFFTGLIIVWLSVADRIPCTPKLLQATGAMLIILTIITSIVFQRYITGKTNEFAQRNIALSNKGRKAHPDDLNL